MLKKACADTTSWHGSICTLIRGWEGQRYSWARSLARVTVLCMKPYVSHSQCKTEINSSFFLEEPDTTLCKVTGKVASAGLQLYSCWQGRQMAQVKENIYFSLSLGLSSTGQNRQSQNIRCTWTAVSAPDSPLCGYNLYVSQKPQPSDGPYINPSPSDMPWNFRSLGNRDVGFTFPLAACLLHTEMGSCFVPVPKPLGFHGITRSAWAVLNLRHSRF